LFLYLDNLCIEYILHMNKLYTEYVVFVIQSYKYCVLIHVNTFITGKTLNIILSSHNNT